MALPDKIALPVQIYQVQKFRKKKVNLDLKKKKLCEWWATMGKTREKYFVQSKEKVKWDTHKTIFGNSWKKSPEARG